MKKRDRIIVIVDRSGSMKNLAKEATAGINRFIKDQKAVKRPADFQLVQFDEKIEIGDIVPLENAGEYSLVPRGLTAMLDAIGMTLAARKTWPGKYGKNICMIVTDGAENSSQEYSFDSISKMIEKLEGKGWEFLFMASNIDANKMGRDIGIRKGHTVTLAATRAGTQDSYSAASAYMASTRCSGATAGALALEEAKMKSSSIT